MYPKLSDLINDLFGTHIDLPIMSYGFFVALAFLVGAWLLYLELKRKGEAGVFQSETKKIKTGEAASIIELVVSFIISFFIGYKLTVAFTDYTNFANDPQKFLFSAEGSFWGGFALGFLYTLWLWYSKEKKKLPEPKWEEVVIKPEDHTWSIVFIAAIFGIIGSKIFDQLENWNSFVQDPIGSLFSFSGLTFYGGLIVAGIAVIWYAEKHHIQWRHLGDSIAPSLIIAYGIGRVGCQIAGDGDWGIVNNLVRPGWLKFLPDWLWAYNYPHNIINEGILIPRCYGQHCMQLAQGVFPTPVYETTLALLIFAFLWAIRKKLKTPGVLFAIYLILNGVERFFIELIRVNNTYDIFGYHITQAEIISVFLVLFGGGLWVFLEKSKMRAKAN